MKLLGISVRPTAVQGALRELGLAMPRGRPPGRGNVRPVLDDTANRDAHRQ